MARRNASLFGVSSPITTDDAIGLAMQSGKDLVEGTVQQPHGDIAWESAGSRLEEVMQYPFYVHRDGDTAFSASFPDLPRAIARGRSFKELKENAQEVVELMYDRSEELIPAPTCSTSELQSLEMDDGKGIWMFIEINLTRVTSKAVSVQFSLPESLLQRVDAAAKQRRTTRSMFFMQAAVHELGNRDEVQVLSARDVGSLSVDR